MLRRLIRFLFKLIGYGKTHNAVKDSGVFTYFFIIAITCTKYLFNLFKRLNANVRLSLSLILFNPCKENLKITQNQNHCILVFDETGVNCCYLNWNQGSRSRFLLCVNSVFLLCRETVMSEYRVCFRDLTLN